MSDTEYSEARNLDFKNQDVDDVVGILSDIRERATIPSRHLLPPQQAVQQVLLRDVPWLCERVLRLEREVAKPMPTPITTKEEWDRTREERNALWGEVAELRERERLHHQALYQAYTAGQQGMSFESATGMKASDSSAREEMLREDAVKALMAWGMTNHMRPPTREEAEEWLAEIRREREGNT